MTVREFLTELQHLPRDAEVLAFEAGCEEYQAEVARHPVDADTTEEARGVPTTLVA